MDGCRALAYIDQKETRHDLAEGQHVQHFLDLAVAIYMELGYEALAVFSMAKHYARNRVLPGQPVN